jgi:hypothetical protein
MNQSGCSLCIYCIPHNCTAHVDPIIHMESGLLHIWNQRLRIFLFSVFSENAVQSNAAVANGMEISVYTYDLLRW